MLKDCYREYHGVVICRGVEKDTLDIKEGLKTVKRGMSFKPIVFSTHLEKVLTILEFRGKKPYDLLFRSIHWKPIGADTLKKHFKIFMPIDLKCRTQYCLRCTFYTEALRRMPEKEVEKIADHKSLQKEYDHRKGIDFLCAAQPLREVINELNAQKADFLD